MARSRKRMLNDSMYSIVSSVNVIQNTMTITARLKIIDIANSPRDLSFTYFSSIPDKIGRHNE
jgi:hypothetical protein